MIEIKNVTIKYGKEIILDNFSTTINENITVILGENGSGKTSLLKAICGLIPFEGEIKNNYKTSYASAEDYLYEYLSARENVEYFGSIFDEDETYWKKCQTIFKLLDFKKEYYEKNVLELSQGNRSKLFLAIVLARNCELFILDEPFASLDNKNQEKILNFISKMNRKIIYTTHIKTFENIALRKIYL